MLVRSPAPYVIEEEEEEEEGKEEGKESVANIKGKREAGEGKKKKKSSAAAACSTSTLSNTIHRYYTLQ